MKYLALGHLQRYWLYHITDNIKTTVAGNFVLLLHTELSSVLRGAVDSRNPHTSKNC